MKIFLKGEAVEGEGAMQRVMSPFDGGVVGEVGQASAAQVEAAIGGMVRAREEFGLWPSYKRAAACAAVAKRIGERGEEFARLMAEEAGKAVRTGRMEVARAVQTFTVAGEEAKRIGGEVLPMDIEARAEGYWGTVESFAVGPCALITPFNFPLNLVAHKVAPAIACGCPFVVKPSERTPLTALLLGEILAEAGLPEGSWSVLPCDRRVAKALVEDERIRLLSFTGSPQVGFAMKAAAGKKNVVLELGNNSAVIVEAGTDLADAVPRIVAGGHGLSGQSCVSVQRVLVQEESAEELTRRLVEATEKVVVGDPLEERTEVGPVIDGAAAERILAWIGESGGELLCGGEREGNLVWPTVVRGPSPESKLVKEEVFGPVVTVETYKTLEEAVGRVNAGRFGLQVGLFCRDLHKVRWAFRRLEVGGVVVNDVPTTRMDHMPYGGVKDSGTGREGGRFGMEHYLERRVMLVRGAPGWSGG